MSQWKVVYLIDILKTRVKIELDWVKKLLSTRPALDVIGHCRRGLSIIVLYTDDRRLQLGAQFVFTTA